MVKRLLNKVVIITGATSGIGLEIARFSISQGANVVISGRRENEGKKIVNQLGERCQFIQCDVLHEDQICTLVEQTFNHYGKIDAIFNNAGAPDFVRNIEDISYDKIRQSLDLLLTSVIIGTREAARIMGKQKYGSIVNTASIAGHWGGCGGSVYSAAKAGVIHFSKVTSLELAKCNVRVNSISPGAIITEIFGVGQKLSAEKLPLSDEHLKSSDAFVDFQPIPRAGLPEDIASLAIYLASDESTFVTGQDFVIDGGLLSGRPLDLASQSFKKINSSLKSIKSL
jgi:NAD(P)-dependent dehydrogenase (short-subunit alcohol dehydrogenase family)